MIAFLDTEFTDLAHPELLSIGAVTLDGREHYVELDMSTDIGKARLESSSDFLRYDGILEMWGLVPGASASYDEMGRRTADWLLQIAIGSGGRVVIAYDYSSDYELMVHAIRDCGLWDRVRKIVSPINIGEVTGTPEGESAADQCFQLMHARGLARHHALADAMALRAAYIAIKGEPWCAAP